jgi:hypothetical protein
VVQSVQRITPERAVVTFDDDGARRLATAYWAAVRHTTRGVVRARQRNGRVALVLLRAVPLLRFGPPKLVADSDCVVATFPIVGGLLATAGGGTLSLQQRALPAIEVSIAVTDYQPRFARRSRRIYTRIQAPAHAAVSRRFVHELGASVGA